MPAAVLPQVNAAERRMMDQLLATKSVNHKQATRLQVVLGKADGKTTTEIAAVLRIHAETVSDIVHRFNEYGVDGLLSGVCQDSCRVWM
jgi:DNA-binding NarL/FixJ family response regulator